MQNMNIWFETQQNFKIFTISILISSNCFGFIVYKNNFLKILNLLFLF
jgi:hypothetical protein